MKKIKFLTAGESHGELLLGIIDGIPSNLDISENYIFKQMKRRQLGFGRGKRMQIENDKPSIYSGVRHGKTLGSPIGIMIKNNDWKNWKRKCGKTSRRKRSLTERKLKRKRTSTTARWLWHPKKN